MQYERERWTADWIKHFDYGGGGIVRLTLFEVDQEILDNLWQNLESSQSGNDLVNRLDFFNPDQFLVQTTVEVGQAIWIESQLL